MWDTLIAVLGTLAGVALASSTQLLTDRRSRAEQQRQRLAEAIDQLLGALLLYRELYWLVIADIREGETETRDARAARYRARSEITQARDRLGLATASPELTAAAKEAAWSVIDLSDIELSSITDGRFSDDVEASLSAGRDRSRAAHTALRRAATFHIHHTSNAPHLHRSRQHTRRNNA
ncbi:hypothetical protein [Streptomyces sp. NPDC127033]|uniref:hypothetical protein n=1 Tax=Streptomyces sp. NPDC127033 TaxID=3347110 RepID=UPI0036504B31